MRRTWALIGAAVLAVVAFLGWLLGRQGRVVVHGARRLPEAEARLEASVLRVERDLVAISRKSEEEIRAVEEVAAKEIRRLSADSAALDAQLAAYLRRRSN